MLIHLDASSTTPLYAQLVASLRRSISTGDVAAGDTLPSAADLAASLDLNRNTVLRAYRELRDDGLVELRRGRGAIVISGPGTGHTNSPLIEETLDELARLARQSSTPLSTIIAGLTIRGVD